MSKRSERSAILLGVIMFLTAAMSFAQTWQGRADLEVRVSSRKGGDLSGARVELKYRDGREGQGPAPVATDRKGRAIILGLAAGTWQVEVKHPDFMSFVAVVRLDSREKPQVTASFLEASSGSSAPIQVKLLKAKGGAASPPLPVIAAAPPPARPEPAPAPTPQAEPMAPPEAPVAAVEPVQPAVPAEPGPASPEMAPPAIEAAPVVSEMTPEPAPVDPEPAPMPREPVDPSPPAMDQPEAMPEPSPAVETRMPDPPAEPAAPAEPTPIPTPAPAPVAEVKPESIPDVTPEPKAPMPAPMPAEPVAEEPQPMPKADPPRSETPEPRAAVEPPVVDQRMAEPEAPSAPMPEPEPIPEAEAEMAAIAAPSTPEATAAPMPEPETTASAPAIEPAPVAMPSEAAAAAYDPAWSSYRQRNCPKCRPGQWAVEVAVSLEGAGSCTQASDDAASAALEQLGSSEQLGAFAGTVGRAVGLIQSGSGAQIEAHLVAARSNGCEVLAVVLPKGSRYVSYEYAIDSAAGRQSCSAGQPCPGGGATFSGPPQITDGAAATVVHGLVAGDDGVALMTVFFRAPTDRWVPQP